MFWRQQQSQKTNTLQQHAGVVEQILASIGVDPTRARMDTENGYGWSFQRGSALIEIYIAEQEGREYLQVLSPLIHVPIGGLLPPVPSFTGIKSLVDKRLTWYLSRCGVCIQ